MKIPKLLITNFFLLSLFSFQSLADSNFPDIGEGLWESTIDGSNLPEGDKTKMCLGKNSAKNLFESSSSLMGGTCGDMSFKKKGKTYTSTLECSVGLVKIESHTVLEGDFKTFYTSTSKIKS